MQQKNLETKVSVGELHDHRVSNNGQRQELKKSGQSKKEEDFVTSNLIRGMMVETDIGDWYIRREREILDLLG